MTTIGDAVIRRAPFNPRPLVEARAYLKKWDRTEKWSGSEWVPIGRWPPVRGVGLMRAENDMDQREGMNRHAEAFGGLIRLMRGSLLLASWQDGVLECDLRDEEKASAAE